MFQNDDWGHFIDPSENIPNYDQNKPPICYQDRMMTIIENNSSEFYIDYLDKDTSYYYIITHMIIYIVCKPIYYLIKLKQILDN